MADKILHLAREEGRLPHPRLFFLAVVLSLIFMDPFHSSPVAGRNYQPVKLDGIVPHKEVMASWRTDNQSRLRNGKLQFAGEVFGPESIEFDPKGRGPYTGLADGRVVRWMGDNVGWETFAVVNPNWNPVFILLEGEATGRLLRYYPTTKSTSVVVSGLTFANGVQISKDETFLLVSETTKCRIMRYWLKGPKATQLELYANLPGFPDNVRINDKGNFWVAIYRLLSNTDIRSIFSSPMDEKLLLKTVSQA